MKKLVSLLLAVALLAGLLSGCGSSGKKKKLVWATFGQGCKEEKLVLEEFNKQLQKYLPGVEIEFVNVWNWNYMISGGEQMDIAWTGYSFDVASETEKDAYTQLDDLVEKYGKNIKQEIKDYPAAYESGRYNDKLYMIPNQQPIIKESAKLIVPVELVKYMNVDALLNACHSSVKTTAEVYEIIEDYFEAIKAADAIDTDTVGVTCDINAIFETMAVRGYDFIGGQKGAWECYDTTVENPQVVSFFDTDAFKLFLKYAGRWYEKGYISEDALVTAGGSGGRASTLSAHPSASWYATKNPKTGEERGVVYDFDEDGNITYHNILVDTADTKYNGVSEYGSEATYLVIPSTAKYPEEAMQLLDLLRAPKGEQGNELYNLLVYGFEKSSSQAKEYKTYHYTLEGDEAHGVDYTIQPSTDSKYGIAHWMLGNAYLAYRTPNILEGQPEYAYKWTSEIQPTYRKTALYGFRGDLSDLSIEVSNVSAAIEEFESQLVYGTKGSNYQSLYDQMVSKAKTAGLQKITDALNKQVQDFLAKK